MKKQHLNNSIDPMTLIDIYIQNISTAAEYTFFSDLHGTLSRMNQILSYETSLNKAENTAIMSSIFLHSGMKPETSNRRKLENSQIWYLEIK